MQAGVATSRTPAVAAARTPRVLIVRLSAIGDVIHALPMAGAIRNRFPGAWITWIVEQRAAELLEGHGALDEVIALPRGWLKSPAGVWQLRKRLRAMRFDVAIDAQGLSKAAIAAWLSGARQRIGFGGSWGREVTPWLNTELIDTDGLHAVERHLRLLGPLGIDNPAVRFDIPHPQEAASAAERIVAQFGLARGFVLVASGAGWPSKLWPADRYAAVALELGRRHGLPSLLVWGNADERARAEQIAAAAAGHARLAPKMTLLELAALARRARLCLGSDTGPLHLAAAVGTPCVGLYGPWPADRHGPWGSQHVTVQKMCMEGTTRQRRNAPPLYMEAIDVASVCRACEQVIERDWGLGIGDWREQNPVGLPAKPPAATLPRPHFSTLSPQSPIPNP